MMERVKAALACILTLVYCVVLVMGSVWPNSHPFWLAFFGGAVLFPFVRDLLGMKRNPTFENCVQMIIQRVPRRLGGGYADPADKNEKQAVTVSASLVPSMPEK
jgi:hypothetical protein